MTETALTASPDSRELFEASKTVVTTSPEVRELFGVKKLSGAIEVLVPGGARTETNRQNTSSKETKNETKAATVRQLANPMAKSLALLYMKSFNSASLVTETNFLSPWKFHIAKHS
jgi:hypothetical protein